MDIHSLLSNPAFITAVNGIVAWGVAQLLKKAGGNPRYAPFVAILTGIISGAGQGALGNGTDSFPVNALLGLLAGLAASGGHEAVKKAAGK